MNTIKENKEKILGLTIFGIYYQEPYKGFWGGLWCEAVDNAMSRCLWKLAGNRTLGGFPYTKPRVFPLGNHEQVHPGIFSQRLGSHRSPLSGNSLNGQVNNSHKNSATKNINPKQEVLT